MRRPLAVLVFACWLSLSGVARAGVYATGEMLLRFNPQTVRDFRLNYGELRAIPSDDPAVLKSPLRERTMKELARLEAKEKDGALTPDDRINLSACYLHRRRFDRAVNVLTPALDQEQPDFMVLCNLAVAYHGLERYDRA